MGQEVMEHEPKLKEGDIFRFMQHIVMVEKITTSVGGPCYEVFNYTNEFRTILNISITDNLLDCGSIVLLKGDINTIKILYGKNRD